MRQSVIQLFWTVLKNGYSRNLGSTYFVGNTLAGFFWRREKETKLSISCQEICCFFASWFKARLIDSSLPMI